MKSSPKIWRNNKNISKFLSMKGEILSWTVVNSPPAGFSKNISYTIVLIQLENGLKITLELVDLGNKTINFGDKVALVVRKIGNSETDEVIEYGIKAKLI